MMKSVFGSRFGMGGSLEEIRRNVAAQAAEVATYEEVGTTLKNLDPSDQDYLSEVLRCCQKLIVVNTAAKLAADGSLDTKGSYPSMQEIQNIVLATHAKTVKNEALMLAEKFLHSQPPKKKEQLSFTASEVRTSDWEIVEEEGGGNTPPPETVEDISPKKPIMSAQGFRRPKRVVRSMEDLGDYISQVS